jgi:hypothetical protein
VCVCCCRRVSLDRLAPAVDGLTSIRRSGSCLSAAHFSASSLSTASRRARSPARKAPPLESRPGRRPPNNPSRYLPPARSLVLCCTAINAPPPLASAHSRQLFAATRRTDLPPRSIRVVFSRRRRCCRARRSAPPSSESFEWPARGGALVEALARRLKPGPLEGPLHLRRRQTIPGRAHVRYDGATNEPPPRPAPACLLLPHIVINIARLCAPASSLRSCVGGGGGPLDDAARAAAGEQILQPADRQAGWLAAGRPRGPHRRPDL